MTPVGCKFWSHRCGGGGHRQSSAPGPPARITINGSPAHLDPSPIVDDLEASEATSADLIDVAPHPNLSGLDEAPLATLGRLLLHRFAFADDQPIPSGAFRPDTQYQVRRIRNLVLEQLAGL